MQRRRRVDFHGDPIHILSPEDLMIYKATFNRDKDWQGIAGIIYACDEPLEFDYLRHWLGRIDSEGGSRVARLEQLIASGGANAS